MIERNYIGKNYDGHIIMLGSEKGSGDFYSTPYPSEKFIYKPLYINDKLKDLGYKYLSKEEVKRFFNQKGKAEND